MILEGEGEKLDFKQEVSSYYKIAKTLCAFANHKGGTLLIGVKDNGKILGIDPEEEKHMIHYAAEKICKPEIPIVTSVSLVNGKSVLEVVTAKGKDKPYYAKDESGKWWAYIRKSDQTLLAGTVLLEMMKKSSSDEGTTIKFSEKQKELLLYIEKNGRITLREYVKHMGIKRRQAINILSQLASLRIIRVHSDEREDYFTIY